MIMGGAEMSRWERSSSKEEVGMGWAEGGNSQFRDFQDGGQGLVKGD